MQKRNQSLFLRIKISLIAYFSRSILESLLVEFLLLFLPILSVYSFFRKCENRRFRVGIYLFKVNNRNTRSRCEICSKLTIKTPEHTSHLVLVFLLLTLSSYMSTGFRGSRNQIFFSTHKHGGWHF